MCLSQHLASLTNGGLLHGVATSFAAQRIHHAGRGRGSFPHKFLITPLKVGSYRSAANRLAVQRIQQGTAVFFEDAGVQSHIIM